MKKLLCSRLLAIIALACVCAFGAFASWHRASGATPERALQQGDRGAPVMELQRLLQENGFDPNGIDGIFGPRTQEAVLRFQRAAGRQANGLVDAQTLQDLRERPHDGSPDQRLVIHQAVETPVEEPAAPASAAISAQRHTFALTFNGNPDEAMLPLLLDVLQRHKMKVTFFVTGEAAALRPDLLARMVAAGHEIANNGQVTIDMTRLTTAMMTAQLLQAQRLITQATGQTPAFFRPPLGRFDERLVAAANALDLSMQLWSNIGVKDLPDAEPTALSERIAETLFPGAVIMMHQDRANTIGTLDALLEAVEQRGYQSVGLSDLANL